MASGLRPGVGIALLAALLGAGCVGTGQPPPDGSSEGRRGAADHSIPRADAASSPIPSSSPSTGDDLVVAEVDGAPLFAGDAYRLLALSLPDEALNTVRQLIVDRIASKEAAAAAITVPDVLIARELERVLADQDRRVRESSKGKQELATYVQATYGLDKNAYKAVVRATVARSLLLERVVLFELSQHPRTQLRLIRVKEKQLAEEIRKKLTQGADFASLARQHSEDGSARDGGVYPPLPNDLPSPLLGRTESIKGGEVGPVEEVSTNDGPRYRIVQVLTRTPAESGSWTERGAGIEQVLEGRRLSPLELEAWTILMGQRHPFRILSLGALAHGS